MIVDAFEDKADAFVLISGDADQSAPLSVVRHKLKKVVTVLSERLNTRKAFATPLVVCHNDAYSQLEV